MSDLKLIDEILCDFYGVLSSLEGGVMDVTRAWRDVEEYSSVNTEAMARLRAAWRTGEMPTLSAPIARYFRETAVEKERSVEHMAPAPDELVPKLMNIRFVLFSPTAGVYLGDNYWSFMSYNPPPPDCTAPTFTSDEYEAIVRQIEIPRNVIRVQCFPDRPDNRASQDAIANAALPRWSE